MHLMAASSILSCVGLGRQLCTSSEMNATWTYDAGRTWTLGAVWGQCGMTGVPVARKQRVTLSSSAGELEEWLTVCIVWQTFKSTGSVSHHLFLILVEWEKRCPLISSTMAPSSQNETSYLLGWGHIYRLHHAKLVKCTPSTKLMTTSGKQEAMFDVRVLALFVSRALLAHKEGTHQQYVLKNLEDVMHIPADCRGQWCECVSCAVQATPQIYWWMYTKENELSKCF